ncbi:MAG: 2-hydroxyacyl-CoA dehydratase [Deltaproteobacteria bacterium]|nr:2-hydroxyacyl-CoA dehydratase [Deltaproteobacteria bacterium]
MEAIQRLAAHVKSRMGDLIRHKKQGGKIVGYSPGGYLPEEIVLAAGAIPVCMARGGDHTLVELAGAYVCRWLDTFCRTQIAYGASGEDPYYNVLDLLAIPITDNHVRAVSDILSYHTGLDIFPFGVPHMKEQAASDYYLHGINRFKEKMENLCSVSITEQKLKQAIELCNRERELFRNISLLRQANPSPVKGSDFVALHHGSLVADKEFMVDVLEAVYRHFQENAPLRESAPRLLFTGSTLAIGDLRVLNLIEGYGGKVVIEEFAEGLRPYWENVSLDGDPMAALADAYFTRRVPPAWFRPGTERLDFLLKLAGDYTVDGVVWYHLLYRESYKTESYYFPRRLKDGPGIPMIVIESDYDASEAGQLSTRIETFMHTLRS